MKWNANRTTYKSMNSNNTSVVTSKSSWENLYEYSTTTKKKKTPKIPLDTEWKKYMFEIIIPEIYERKTLYSKMSYQASVTQEKSKIIRES